ncbi:hypothetical protein D3C83_176200 [compost metagenome]
MSLHETGCLEALDVEIEQGTADPQLPRELADVGRAAGEGGEDPQSLRVGDGAEGREQAVAATLLAVSHRYFFHMSEIYDI